MIPGRTLGRVLGVWACATAIACAAVHHTFSLSVDEAHSRGTLASVWSAGALVARAWLARAGERDPRLDVAMAAHPGATLVYESIVGESPVIRWPEVAFALSLVSGRDGLSVTWQGRTEAVTPDDLLSRQAYDRDVEVRTLGISAGVDVQVVLAVLSERMGVSVRDLLDGGRFRRIRVVRSIPAEPAPRVVRAETMTDDDVRAAVIAAGGYLARGVDPEGRFRYLVDAPTNATLGGYDLPRHAGATYFLAQAAALSGDGAMAASALRAASFLRDGAIVPCGPRHCVSDGPTADLGSTALAVIAFVEIARAGLDPAYGTVARDLAAFLRSQQRPDGEFMHLYDRAAARPRDVQLLYYTGEAALALSRAHALLGDAADLAAAMRAVAYLVGPGWSFFGSRYYFGEEHWTCQAMADLWERAPNLAALDFCLRWQAFDRQLQYGPGDSPFDADGAYGAGPVLIPRLTPVASRAEAGIATLAAARQAGLPPHEMAPLEAQLQRSLALLLRHQLGVSPAAPRYLFADPGAVAGAMPGSAVDWRLRIDYAQHTGSALIRWLSLRMAAPAP
ncbi:MAG: hypothetical protein FWD17_02845 [Polyangiaceae bacterium]|nr:hypothetical protein [Polyangiaceae bacterium]